MIQCYFGNGKGKTTASVGAAIRYLGCEKRVLYVSFLKDGTSSELNILTQLPNLEVKIPPVVYRLYDNQNPQKTEALSQAYTCFFCEELQRIAPSFDMIVMDEILDTVSFGYLEESRFLELVKSWSNRSEIILTGHKLSENIARICDYISEVSSKKHPFEQGKPSRRGIEY